MHLTDYASCSSWWPGGIVTSISSALSSPLSRTFFRNCLGADFDEDHSGASNCVQYLRFFTSWREVGLAFGSLPRVITTTACWDQDHKANIMISRLWCAVNVSCSACVLRTVLWTTVWVWAVVNTALLGGDRMFRAFVPQFTSTSSLSWYRDIRCTIACS